MFLDTLLAMRTASATGTCWPAALTVRQCRTCWTAAAAAAPGVTVACTQAHPSASLLPTPAPTLRNGSRSAIIIWETAISATQESPIFVSPAATDTNTHSTPCALLSKLCQTAKQPPAGPEIRECPPPASCPALLPTTNWVY